MALAFRKATRERVFIKMGVTGPSGSGKTEGALYLAEQLVPGGKIAVIDTENGSASLYADKHEFDVIDLPPPYESRFYTEAINAAVAAGYDVLIIDSLSHQWDGSGGILDRKTAEERNGRNVNGFALWGRYKEEHRKFIAGMLHAPIHIIACMRAKQQFVQDGNKIKKLGMEPITGENAEYEFSVVFDLNMEHQADTSKDRTRIFQGNFVDLIRDKPGEKIRAWLAAGAEPTQRTPAAAEPKPSPREQRGEVAGVIRPDPEQEQSSDGEPAPGTVAWARAYPLPWKKSKQYGQPLGTFSKDHLESIAQWCSEKIKEATDAGARPNQGHVELREATRIVLEDLSTAQARLALDEDGPDLGTSTGDVPVQTAGSGQVPPSGKVEDALQPNAAAPRNLPAEAAPDSVHALTQQINALLADESIDELTRKKAKTAIRKHPMNHQVLERELAALEKAKKLTQPANADGDDKDDELPF